MESFNLKLVDLKTAVEFISGDQLKEESSQCVIRAGWIQSKHVEAPAVDILRGTRGGWVTALLMHICAVCSIFFVMSDLLHKHTTHSEIYE